MQSLRTAQANIKRARDEVEEMLSHLDTARQVCMLPGMLTVHLPHQAHLCNQMILEGAANMGKTHVKSWCGCRLSPQSWLGRTQT